MDTYVTAYIEYVGLELHTLERNLSVKREKGPIRILSSIKNAQRPYVGLWSVPATNAKLAGSLSGNLLAQQDEEDIQALIHPTTWGLFKDKWFRSFYKSGTERIGETFDLIVFSKSDKV